MNEETKEGSSEEMNEGRGLQTQHSTDFRRRERAHI
jgi:hypothetical protein